MSSASSDNAYEWIRRRIISREFPPGHPLVADSLADQLNMSRTPVREALRMLQSDGLITIHARLGASVKKVHLKEFLELCEVRLALESQSAGLAATRRTVAELQEIRLALESMRRLTQESEDLSKEQAKISELGLEDLRFHIGILTAAKNELLKKEILRLHLIYRIACPPPGPERLGADEYDHRVDVRRSVLAAHEEIYSAIAAGDTVKAKQAMDRHIQYLIDLVSKKLARSESGFIGRELTPEELIYNV